MNTRDAHQNRPGERPGTAPVAATPRARRRPTPTTTAGALPASRALALLAIVCIALLSFTLPACNRAPAPPSSTAPRYVVLSPALAIMLRDLGQEDRIVARHAFDLVLDESLPVAGELGRIDYETLIAARPTHVLVEWGAQSQPLPERLVELARQRGFSVQRYSMLTLQDIIDAVDRLESDLPPSDRGPDEGYWHERMVRAWKSGTEDDQGRPRLADAGRVLLVASTSPTIAVFGPGSWHHQILEAIGGVPAITRGGPWIELSPEDVLRLAPDAIIFIDPRGRDQPARGLATPADVSPRLGVIARLDIPAIRGGRVALIDDPLAHTPSTAMVSLTARIQQYLTAWAASVPTAAELDGLAPGGPQPENRHGEGT